MALFNPIFRFGLSTMVIAAMALLAGCGPDVTTRSVTTEQTSTGTMMPTPAPATTVTTTKTLQTNQ
jgi:uncharacterized lipoprotein YajG